MHRHVCQRHFPVGTHVLQCICMTLQVPPVVVGNRSLWVEKSGRIHHDLCVCAHPAGVILLFHGTRHNIRFAAALVYDSTRHASYTLTCYSVPGMGVSLVNGREHECHVHLLPPCVDFLACARCDRRHALPPSSSHPARGTEE